MKDYRVVLALQSVEAMGEVETVEVVHLSKRLGHLESKRIEFDFFARLCEPFITKGD